MSVDEIRAVKGQVLLDYQEAEDRVYLLHQQLQARHGVIDRFARAVNPGAGQTPKVPNLETLNTDEFRNALDFESTLSLAAQLSEAVRQLDEAKRRKQELGLH